jgi:ribonuclease D
MRPPSQPPHPVVVTRDDALRDLLATLGRADRVAVDIEASGMFAYHARPCTVQLGWDDGDDGTAVAIVDVLAVPIGSLAPLLGESGPLKIVHDVAFDARLLAENRVVLGNVHDTSVAARMLSRQATGLATLLDVELGVRINKSLQQHDWRERPLDEAMLTYLAADVAHLGALERKLWSELAEHGIEDAVLEETRYRLASAAEASSEGTPPPPPYARVKGASRLGERDLAGLRVVAELREQEARRRDVPPHQVASAEAIIAIARARPTSLEALAKTRGIGTATPEAREFAASLVRALATAGDRIPEEDRVHFEPVRVPAEQAKLRREREVKLTAWRRAEAKRRGVDEQVVLPGHCLKDAASLDVRSLADLARVPGIGAFRIARDGEAMASVLFATGVEATA